MGLDLARRLGLVTASGAIPGFGDARLAWALDSVTAGASDTATGLLITADTAADTVARTAMATARRRI